MSGLVKCPGCLAPKRIECRSGFTPAIVNPCGGMWADAGPRRVECRCGRGYYVMLFAARGASA